MNLVAASRRAPETYVAFDDQVAIYDTPTTEGINEPLKPEKMIERRFAADGSEGYIYPQHVYSNGETVP